MFTIMLEEMRVSLLIHTAVPVTDYYGYMVKAHVCEYMQGLKSEILVRARAFSFHPNHHKTHGN